MPCCLCGDVGDAGSHLAPMICAAIEGTWNTNRFAAPPLEILAVIIDAISYILRPAEDSGDEFASIILG